MDFMELTFDAPAPGMRNSAVEATPGSELALQRIITHDGVEGLVVGYQFKYAPDSTLTVGEAKLATRWALYVGRNDTTLPGAPVLKDRYEHGDYETFSTLAMWPSLIPSHSFSTWSCY